MYCIKKYSAAWTIFNVEEDMGRRLTEDEVESLRVEFPELNNSDISTVFTEEINSLNDKP